MKGDLIRGKELCLQDYFANTSVTHANDVSLGGRADVLESSGSEDQRSTTIEFHRKLDTGDRFDRPITPGQHTVQMAYAPTDDFVAGLLALIASIITGFTYTWPREVLLTSSVVLNKVAITAFSTTFWVLFIWTRAMYRTRLWSQARLRRLYATLATGGFLTLMLAGSTGGHLAGKRSMLDGVLHYLGINTHLLFALSRSTVYVTLSAVALLVALAGIRRVVRTRSSPRHTQARAS